MTKVSVVSIVWNEVHSIRYFLDQFKWREFIQEIIIIDGGSDDGTLDVINEYKEILPIGLHVEPQNGARFSKEWNESSRRNMTLAWAQAPWVMMVDADEIVDESIWCSIPSWLDQDLVCVGFDRINYFVSPNYIFNFPDEDRGVLARLWRNFRGINYTNSHLHCMINLHGFNLTDMIRQKQAHTLSVPLPFHHLHRMLWPGKPAYIEYDSQGKMVLQNPPECEIMKLLESGKVRKFDGPWPSLFNKEGWV